jgi:hypothetical protein
MTTLQQQLVNLQACPEARAWVGERDLATAWAECERADWMLWFASKLGVDRKLLVKAACACARTAMPFVPKKEARPLKAIETAEAWCRREASIEEVRAAAVAAYAAAYAHAAYAYAARAAYADADAAAADAAKVSSQKQCADLVRSIIKLEDLKS